jgi:ABC-type glycerol-3-phosphate transport system permease component
LWPKARFATEPARFYEYGPLFAASVLAILPPVAVAFFFQGYLVMK